LTKPERLPGGEMILEVEGLNAYYGSSHILFDVSLGIDQGQAVVLLGRNGAGKTTTLKSIMGIVHPRSGRITFKGKRVDGLPSYRIARLGIGFVPEDRVIFPDLTVRENLEIAQRKREAGEASWTIEKIFRVFPVLEKFQGRNGGTLSGGEQQMLTIARTLMGNPEFLLLDEPVEGLAPLIVRMLGQVINQIKDHGVTLLMSEQNVKFSFKIAQKVYIIDKGTIRYEGSVEDLKANEEVKKKYLAV
jgi:branched-chain amino acid transport system ATP-binding protein